MIADENPQPEPMPAPSQSEFRKQYARVAENSPAEEGSLVRAGVPGMLPETVYAAGILEPPLRDMLTIRGRGNQPMALLEVPALGPFMGVQALGAGPLGVLMLMDRPLDDDQLLMPHPAFMPPGFHSEVTPMPF